jgi:transcriptional regulator
MVQRGDKKEDIAKVFNTSRMTVYKAVAKIKDQKEKQENIKIVEMAKAQQVVEVQAPYDKLYGNRTYIVELKTRGLLNVEIAKMMNVSDQDVFDFFEKRVRLTPQQIKEVKGLYDKGKSVEVIAGMYKANVETIKKICKVTIINKDENTEVAEDIMADLDVITKFYQWVHQIEIKATNVNNEELKYEKQQQDLLHRIEMEDHEDDEILELARQIKEIRQKRRECKDFLQLVNPIIEFMKEEANAKPLRTLANLAGRVNNEAKKVGNRVYFLRTRESEDGENE